MSRDNYHDIIIIGAGACGLMAGRELARAGRKVLILEACDGVGGRIKPLDVKEFGYAAEGGAEFIHGDAPITVALLREAGLNYRDMGDSEMWNARGGVLTHIAGSPGDEESLAQNRIELDARLKELKEDMPVSGFLKKYFAGPEHEHLRNWVLKMAIGFDAADPDRISTYSLRDEWLGGREWKQGMIKEGYGALADFLAEECRRFGAEIKLGCEVLEISRNKNGVKINCADGEEYMAGKIIVTASVNAVKNIKFTPAIPEKFSALEKIGFGQVIKVLIRFKDVWWAGAWGQNLSRLKFMLCDGDMSAWWTQYPERHAVLTGWVTGPKVEELKGLPDRKILERALLSLAEVFQTDIKKIREEVLASRVVNWPADRFTLGAYSYSAVGAEEAYREMRSPVEEKVYFAGEALYSGFETATVEGALASGKETAGEILGIQAGRYL